MKQFYAGNPEWLVLDQTYQSVEETSARILRVMSERLGEENSKWRGSSIWPQPVPFPLPYSLLWLLLPGIHHPGNGMPGLRHWRHLTPSGPGAAEVPDASEPPSPDQQPLLMPLSNLPAPIATGLKRYPVTCWRSSDKNALMALLFLLRTKKGWHCKSGDPKDYCRRMADMQMIFLYCWVRGNPGQQVLKSIDVCAAWQCNQ